VLNINPKMLPRLDEIETDLLALRARAEQEGRLGEIEGIDLTLIFVRQKREESQWLARIGQPRHAGCPARDRSSRSRGGEAPALPLGAGPVVPASWHL
jgi:hypothetical protein